MRVTTISHHDNTAYGRSPIEAGIHSYRTGHPPFMAAWRQADVLTKIPLALEVPPCRLLASVVRNFCSSAVALLDVLPELSDDPSAVKRLWKSVDSVLSLDEVLAVLVSVDVLPELELVVEPDVSDCARLSIADARSPPYPCAGGGGGGGGIEPAEADVVVPALSVVSVLAVAFVPVTAATVLADESVLPALADTEAGSPC
jgi:hypothetical protein